MINSTKTYKIKVTANDILQGKRKKSTCCPIAIAASRVVEGTAIAVGTVYLAFNPHSSTPHRHYKKLILLPEEARAFICKFDRGKPVTPFSFELEV